jgi:hypothetical protein
VDAGYPVSGDPAFQCLVHTDVCPLLKDTPCLARTITPIKPIFILTGIILTADNGDTVANTAFVKGQVINNLTSTDTNRPLSAAQGKALQDGKAPLANPSGGQNNYAPLASPNFSGSPTISSSRIAAVSDSSVLMETSLPVGSVILAQVQGGTMAGANTTVNPFVRTNGYYAHANIEAGSLALSGTWKSSGPINFNSGVYINLYRRVI